MIKKEAGKLKPISVREFSSEGTLELDACFGLKKEALDKKITSNEVHSPLLSILGNSKGFCAGCIQAMGKAELAALRQDLKSGRENFRKIFKKGVPCFVVTARLELPAVFLKEAKKEKIPVFATGLSQAEFTKRALQFFEEKMSHKITIQGVMMDICGMGVLIRGCSGIGKSESALELLKMGHRIISDDMIVVKRRPSNVIVASSPVINRHYIEVRGLGIVDVESIFGIGSVRDAIKVELVVNLEEWDKVKEYDRLGTEKKFAEILGIKLPEVVIPVTAGRNLAVIIELEIGRAHV